jgi:hypothetical protein
MANLTGGNLRALVVGPALAVLEREVALGVAAVEANSASYSTANFAAMAEALDSARDLIHDAALANEATGNPN